MVNNILWRENFVNLENPSSFCSSVVQTCSDIKLERKERQCQRNRWMNKQMHKYMEREERQGQRNKWINKKDLPDSFSCPLGGPWCTVISPAFPEDWLTSELGILESYFQVDRKGVIEKICQNHIIAESLPICDHISSHWTLDFWILMEVTFT